MTDEQSPTLIQRAKGLLFHSSDWDELKHLKKPCPRCGNETLYRDEGRVLAVDRCRNDDCRFEGVTKA